MEEEALDTRLRELTEAADEMAWSVWLVAPPEAVAGMFLRSPTDVEEGLEAMMLTGAVVDTGLDTSLVDAAGMGTFVDWTMVVEFLL